MDRTLSKDVRLLGDTLGETLRAHGGEALFERVERMRNAAKRARDEHHDADRCAAREVLSECAGALDAENALEVARAFMTYFQLVNLAEDVHRTRELRGREMRGGPESVAESLAAVLDDLATRGATREEMLRVLGEVKLAFVFTAHPTEARRRTTQRILARARQSLEDLDRRALTPSEAIDLHRKLEASVESLWEHAAVRRERPDVLEEVKAGLWYLRNVLFDAVPRAMRRLHRAFEESFGALDPVALPMPVSFGSWMGGDRDGNPYVNEGVTERTLELHHWIALDRYASDLDALVDPLAGAAGRVVMTEALEAALVRAAAAVPEAVSEANRRNPFEPFRRLLTFVKARIERTRSFGSGGYRDPDEFLEDLLALRGALIASHARSLPDDALLDLIQRVRCFGFVLAPVDVREDARVHRRVVGELLGDPRYPERPDAERIAALASLELPSRASHLSPDAQRLLALFAGLGRVQSRFGSSAIRAYVVTMTEQAADVLEIHRLAELHGISRHLDFVPLLETESAQRGVGPLLEGLLSAPSYRAHLVERERTQEILVGYSDSMKESGVLSSRARILQAQREASRILREQSMRLRVFHGRGGSVSRGGGPTYRAIRALPRDAFGGEIRITEQGETRDFHFGHPDLSVRYLEQTLGAALAVRWEAIRDPGGPPPDEIALVEELAERSRHAYRRLVEDEALVRYFQETTPVDAIADLNIASRPSKRGSGGTIDTLRAIPWVFAWTQSRHVITGWFGVGTALEGLFAAGKEREVREIVLRSPFLVDLLDNVQMTLAKTDLPIAERYASLAEDPEVRRTIFEAIRAEFVRTRDALLRLFGREDLLVDDPVLRRSIRLRNPYVDPLSYLQVEALGRRRSATDADERAAWDRVVRLTVQGIAAGLRNTG